MLIDVSAIDAEIERLQKIRALAIDPEMQRLFEKFVKAEATPPSPSVPAAVSDEDEGGKLQRGALKRAVTERALQKFEWFTGYELKNEMQADGFPFTAARPEITVLEVLRTMGNDGQLEVQKGEGNSPNRYRAKQLPLPDPQ
ncbi:MAG: hypothetical protein JNK87_33890 [Bryobacterales bacterium]|nr:hypothetical protein [Bryobacterales bacterium]